jgi:hypothetical protein
MTIWQTRVYYLNQSFIWNVLFILLNLCSSPENHAGRHYQRHFISQIFASILCIIVWLQRMKQGKKHLVRPVRVSTSLTLILLSCVLMVNYYFTLAVSLKGLKMVFHLLYWICLIWIMIFHREFTVLVDGMSMVIHYKMNLQV